MRCMIRIHLDTAASNDAIKRGNVQGTIKTLMEKLKPEAAYFGLSEGVRTNWFVCDLDDPSALPPLFEPLFMEFNAEIDVSPVMNFDDLMKGLSQLQSAPR